LNCKHPAKKLIGPLTQEERLEKLRKYICKRRLRHTQEKFQYKCRKQVAQKRLRIKGRFVTKEQAYEMLGLDPTELKSNEFIQKLLEKQFVELNSLVEGAGGSRIKVRNFQALIDDHYDHSVVGVEGRPA